MTTQQKALVTATVPVLKSSGNTLISYFYNRMLTGNPELRDVFNLGNQANGKQHHALTGAVLAYAENIENPEVLINALKMIGNKHVSLNITADQYEIVGRHLIESIKEVLGDAATPELIDAWTCAYNQLAEILIKIEADMYQHNEQKKGGWKGWRNFVISKIVKESDEIKSFYLTPQDKKDIMEFRPGQYVSVSIFIDQLGHKQPRQYSLSNAFNNEYYRISVKIEKAADNPDGLVSNLLHSKKEGDVIEVSAPSGIFYADTDSQNPLVLISGGVGITPMMSMVETNKNLLQKNKTVWVHGCRNENVHAFKENIETLNAETDWLSSFVFYESTSENQTNAISGRVNLEEIKDEILIDGAKYYICGPAAFIKAQYQSLVSLGVGHGNILFEEFGPQLLNLN